MNTKLQTVLISQSAGVRLRNVMWANGRIGNITVRRFIKEWPLKRLKTDAFGFGRTMQDQLARALDRWATDIFLHRKEKFLPGLRAYIVTLTSPKLGRIERDRKIAAAAKAFCDAHKSDYIELLNSNSASVDAEFLNLCHAVYGETKSVGNKFVPAS